MTTLDATTPTANAEEGAVTNRRSRVNTVRDQHTQDAPRITEAKPRNTRHVEDASVYSPPLPVAVICEAGDIRHVRSWGCAAIERADLASRNAMGAMVQGIARADVHTFAVIKPEDADITWLVGMLGHYGRVRRIGRKAFEGAKHRRDLVELIQARGRI